MGSGTAKTWLIADGIPEIAQAKRLGHHLSNRLVEVYSHVAPEIETKLLRGLERRWKQAATSRRPPDNRPGRKRGVPDPHTAPAQRTTTRRTRAQMKPQAKAVDRKTPTPLPATNPLQFCSRMVHTGIHFTRGNRSTRASERPSGQRKHWNGGPSSKGGPNASQPEHPDGGRS